MAATILTSDETMNDQERSKLITFAIKDADRDMRRRFPILNHQDALGAGFFLACTSTIIVTSLLFIQGTVPWWLCIMINAFCMSLLREIEHDLIHNLYFATRPWIQNLMMAGVWPFLGNLPHPWYRRRMHLLHHRSSGTDDDFEERLIGNGLPFGPLKILAMLEPGIASLFRKKEFKEIPFYDGGEFFRALIPVAVFHLTAWYSWLVANIVCAVAYVAGAEMPETFGTIMMVLNTIAVVFVVPNQIRQVCLQILSSTMHYFGDVENHLQETQVLNAWYLLPLQLFTCNFGATHTIHHFLVSQPFYLRQLVAAQAHAAFKKYGVRFNDAETVLRGNRWN